MAASSTKSAKARKGEELWRNGPPKYREVQEPFTLTYPVEIVGKRGRARGGAGYVVDENGPMESELLRGQRHKLGSTKRRTADEHADPVVIRRVDAWIEDQTKVAPEPTELDKVNAYGDLNAEGDEHAEEDDLDIEDLEED